MFKGSIADLGGSIGEFVGPGVGSAAELGTTLFGLIAQITSGSAAAA
ncbi:hypothetical protein [Tomitella biformata]|nr:hypothetical protein [Tomitella biformata]